MTSILAEPSPVARAAPKLAANPAPAVRLMALRRLEEALDSLDRPEIDSVLDTFEGHLDAATEGVVRRIRGRLRARSFEPESGPRSDQNRSDLHRMLETVRGSAMGLFGPVIASLRSHLESFSPLTPEGDEVWRAVAAIGHPDTLGLAIGHCKLGAASPAVVDALLTAGTRESEEQLSRLMEGPPSPAQLRATASLPGLRHMAPELMLAKAARSPAASVRTAAASATTRLPRSKSAPWLLELTRDASEPVALAALAALAGRRGSSVAAALTTAAQKGKSEAIRAVAILAMATQPECDLLDLLTRLTREGAPPRLLAAAARGLVFSECPPEPAATLLSNLSQSTSPLVRAAALLALFPFQATRTEEELTLLMERAEDGARLAGAGAVVLVQPAGLIRKAVGLLLREHKVPVQAALMTSLESVSPNCSPELLLPLFTASPWIRLWATELCGRMPGQDWGAHFLRLAREENDSAVRAALQVASARRAGLAAIKSCLASRDPQMQLPAIDCLQSFSAVEAGPLLDPLLDSSDGAVFARAAVALWRLGRLEVLGRVQRMLGEARDSAKRQAGLAALRVMAESMDVSALDRFPELARALGRAAAPRATDSGTRAAAILEPPTTAAQEKSPPRGNLGEDLEIEELLRTSSSENSAWEIRVQGAELQLPDTVEGRFLRLRTLMESESEDLGEYARHYLDRPADPLIAPYLALGKVFARRWEQSDSVRAYLRAFESEVALLQEVASEVRTMLDENEVAEAEGLLSFLGKLLPLDSGAHREAGQALLSAGRLEAAYRQLYLAHLVAPADPRTTLELAVCAIQTGRRDLARELAETLRDAQLEDSRWVTKARKLLASLEKKR